MPWATLHHLSSRPQPRNLSNYLPKLLITQATSTHASDVAEFPAIIGVQNQRWTNVLEDVDQRDRNLDNTLRLQRDGVHIFHPVVLIV